MRVGLTGASGLIGTALTASLRADGHDVVVFVRRAPAGPGEFTWDPAGQLSPAAVDGLDAVVHLSGAPVAARRWTPARKQVLRDSRVASTATLVSAISGAASPPPVLVCASAIGWYGQTGQTAVEESAPAGSGFLPQLVKDWESAAEPAAAAGVRVVRLRSGLVLSRRGGMLGAMLPLFRLGLGGRVGDGRQYLSWITLTDHVGAVRFLLERGDLAGPVNLTAPAPVTNAEFTRALAAATGRPAVLAVPAPAVRLALGELSAELLGSCRVLPARLQQAGFAFRHPEIGAALPAVLASQGSRH